MVNYEEIIGKVYFAVDPKLPHNQIIVDLDRAPRNAKGLVEFSADLYVLKPKDPAKSNGTALLEISNRGGKGMLGMFDLAPSGSTAPPRTAADLGDPLLFQSGYTLVWVGWEFDVPDSTNMKLYAPVIRGITGPVRAEIIVDKRETTASLADRKQIPYSVADQASATLTVRDHPTGPVTRYRAISGNSTPMPQANPAGFEPGRIYDVVYTGKDPPSPAWAPPPSAITSPI
jgi:hypothetical protein